jgi:xylulokinase
MDISIKEVISMGGGAKSALWNQIKADICNVIIKVPVYTEAALLGSAILTANAIGIFSSIEETCKKFISIKTTYYPEEKNFNLYKECYEKYQDLYKSLIPIFGN